MEIPRVNPVGVVEVPKGYVTRARRLPAGLRLAAAAILIAFVMVSTATTVASLGRYCLTSQASSPAAPDPR